MSKELEKLLLKETKLCKRGEKAAKAKYDKWPSAYASAYAVKVCKGQVKDQSGKKKTASGYRKKNNKPKNEEYKSEIKEFKKFKELFEQFKNDITASGIVDEKYVWNNLNEAEYRGRKVKLNKPFRDSSGNKKFAVYVKNKKGNVIKVGFGAKGYRVKNNDPEARKSFRKRHKCDQKKDKTKARYWACNIGRYAKSLGLSSSKKW